MGTYTANLGLEKPDDGATDWGTSYRAAFDTIDGEFGAAAGHNHSGTAGNGPKLTQANTHQSADTDTVPTAIHHTLGTGANQAAAGNHLHDDRYYTEPEVDAKLAAMGASAPGQTTYLVSGGAVTWVSGYTYRVAAATYYLAGTQYSSAAANVTLAGGDATYDRIDVIALQAAGPTVIAGTPAADPVEPALDPATALKLQFVLVGAATTAASVTTEAIYQEGTEWTGVSSAATIVLTATAQPNSGTKSVEATAAVNGTNVVWTRASAFDPNSYAYLVLQVRPKAGYQGTLKLTWYAANKAKGSAYNITTTTITAGNLTYQTVAIPMSAFAIPAGTTVDKLRLDVVLASGTTSFYLDDVIVQTGSQPVSSSDTKQVKVSATDNAEGFLQSKLAAGSGITLTKNNAGGNETLTIAATASGLDTTAGDARYTQRANNLSDVASAATARSNLGLGTAATRDVAATGNATSSQVVKGDDTRLTDSRTPTAHTHPVSDLSATGTPSSTTYLRGDGTWSTPASGGTTLTVKEADNTPTVSAATLIFPNGTLTDNGSGSVTYTPASGGMTNPMTSGGDLIIGNNGATVNEATTARGATFSATDGSSIASAFDGNDTTFWTSATGSGARYLQADLGSSKTIASYRLWQHPSGFQYAGNVQYSLDGSTNWTNVASFAANSVDSGEVAFSGGAVAARYWRIYASSTSGSWTISTLEFRSSGVVIGSPMRLAVGATNQVLGVSSSLPSWRGNEAWTAPTFTNSWANVASMQTAGYWIDPLGMVHLRGTVRAGAVNTSMFTLPTGYRPTAKERFVCISSDGTTPAVGYIDIDTTGTVTYVAGATVTGASAFVSLAGITFRNS